MTWKTVSSCFFSQGSFRVLSLLHSDLQRDITRNIASFGANQHWGCWLSVALCHADHAHHYEGNKRCHKLNNSEATCLLKTKNARKHRASLAFIKASFVDFLLPSNLSKGSSVPLNKTMHIIQEVQFLQWVVCSSNTLKFLGKILAMRILRCHYCWAKLMKRCKIQDCEKSAGDAPNLDPIHLLTTMDDQNLDRSVLTIMENAVVA